MKSALVVTTLLALLGGCGRTPCEELEAAPISGTYKGGGTLGGERMLRVAIAANQKQVVLTYTAMDGSRIRATYRVAKRLKKALSVAR